MPKEKPYRIYDTGGLYLEIKPSGKRIWRLRYNMYNREKSLTMGDYPALGLIKAREQRDMHKVMIANGIDPSAIKQEDKRLAKFHAAQSLEEVGREWYERNRDNWTRKHSHNILRRLELYVFPRLGRKPISDLTPLDVLDCLQKIEDRGILHTAKRILQIISQVLRYAVVTGRATRDFTPDLKGSLKRSKGGHYAAISSEELPELVRAIEQNKPRMFRQTILATKLLMLTFVRTSELINATWCEFDFDKKIWSIPAERMKMSKPHIVPLSNQVVSILNELKELFGDMEKAYILPSVINKNKPISNLTILKGLERLGYKGRMTGHGFRALAMSTIKEHLKYQHDVVDRQLAHVHKNAVDKAYDRAQFLEERTKMMQDWADYIDMVILPKEQKKQPQYVYGAAIRSVNYQIVESYSGSFEYRLSSKR